MAEARFSSNDSGLGPEQSFFDIQFSDIFGSPPNGSYAATLFVTEFDNGPLNGGFSIGDFG